MPAQTLPLAHPDALLPLIDEVRGAIQHYAEVGDCTSADALHCKLADLDRVRAMLSGEDDQLLALLRNPTRKEGTLMLTPNHYMRGYSDAQLDAIIGDPRHYGVGERLDADNLRRERRAAAIASQDATRRAIIGAAPLAP